MKKQLKYALLFALTLFLFSGCHHQKHADKIFYNGKIYLVDGSFSTVEAFAIEKGKIREVGLNEDILDDYTATETIDLKGESVYPGFIDAHCHFYGYATGLMKCDLYGTGSFDNVLKRLAEFYQVNKFSWLLGRGWDQNDWAEKSFPTNAKLDSLFPDIPVFISRIDGHAALCNTKALTLSGINANTKVDGGEIVLMDGKPTGLLVDNAVEIVSRNIPVFTKEQIDNALLEAQTNCFAAGLTTVDDAGLGKDSIFQMLELQKSGQLKMRIYAMISDDPVTLNYFFKNGPFKNEMMSICAIKTYADGSLGSRGACMKREYNDQKGHFGYLIHPREYYDLLAEKALDHGFQLCTHAIGDSANKVVIEVYADHLSTENHRRWRIEHCQIIDPKDRRHLSDYSIIPSVQPTHATSDMYWAQDRIGKDRMPFAYAYEELRDECDGVIVFGTDFPVEDISPIKTFYAAVARKDLKGYPKDGFQPENKIKRKDALKAMTIQAAFSNFEDEEKGSIEEGKYADFVILSKDIMKVDEDEIPKTKVLATYINGEKVYEKK